MMEDEKPDRRTVLKTMGAVSVTSISMGNAAGSRSRNGHTRATVERLRRVKQKYDTSDKIERVFERHGAELLRKLNERGILPHASVDKLQISDLLSTEEYINASEGTHVMGVSQKDDTPTAMIYVRRQTGEHSVLLVVKPEADEAHAIFNELGSDEKYIVSDRGDGDFSTQHSGCIGDPVCMVTNSWCQEMWIHCCDGYCHEDELTGDGCSSQECCWSHCCEACCQCDPGCGSC
jgi:hypothetical protein